MPDITIPPKQWVNVHSLSGINASSGLLFQSKTPNALPLLIESAAQPGADSREGRLAKFAEEVEVGAGSIGLWAFSYVAATAFVQEV